MQPPCPPFCGVEAGPHLALLAMVSVIVIALGIAGWRRLVH